MSVQRNPLLLFHLSFSFSFGGVLRPKAAWRSVSFPAILLLTVGMACHAMALSSLYIIVQDDGSVSPFPFLSFASKSADIHFVWSSSESHWNARGAWAPTGFTEKPMGFCIIKHMRERCNKYIHYKIIKYIPPEVYTREGCAEDHNGDKWTLLMSIDRLAMVVLYAGITCTHLGGT